MLLTFPCGTRFVSMTHKYTVEILRSNEVSVKATLLHVTPQKRHKKDKMSLHCIMSG